MKAVHKTNNSFTMINTKILYAIAVASIIVVVVPYAMMFRESHRSGDPAHWGQLGDYVGGLLNPIFAVLNVYITIHIARSVSGLGAIQQKQQAELQEKLTKFQIDEQYKLLRSQVKFEILKSFTRAVSEKTSLLREVLFRDSLNSQINFLELDDLATEINYIINSFELQLSPFYANIEELILGMSKACKELVTEIEKSNEGFLLDHKTLLVMGTDILFHFHNLQKQLYAGITDRG